MEKQLPKNWVQTELGKITTNPQYGWTSKAGNVGEVKYLRTTDLSKGKVNWETVPYCIEVPDNVSKYQVEKNDILISRAGSVGFSHRVENAPDKAVFASYLIRFKPLIVNPKIIEHYLNSAEYWNGISDVSAGIAVQNINAPKLSALKFLLPPLAEQNRIVAKLDSLFVQLEIIKTSIATIPVLLKNFRQQVLTQAVTGKLTESWRVGKELESVDEYVLNIKNSQEQEFLELQELNLKLGLKKVSKRDNKILSNSELRLNIPNEWRVSRIADVICDLTDYHANGSYIDLKANVKLREEVNYACMIRSTNFEKNNFDSLMIYIDEKAYNFMSRSKLFGNEILISKIGNAGSVYFMPQLNRPASLAMNLFALRIDKNVSSKFILYHLISPFSIENIAKYVRGVATKSIDKISVRSLMIGLPSPKEQQEIVSRVESLFAKADAIEKQYQTLKQKIETLPQAILHKAFKGELVAQLDTDGDARELLQQIQELKGQTAKVSKKKVVAKVKECK